MNVYLYLDQNTFFHRLDPRTKILLLAAAFTLSVVYTHPLYVGVACALILLHATFAKAWPNLNRLRPLLIMIVIMGTLLWSLYGQGVTPFFWFIELEPFLYGLGTSIKLFGVLAAGMAFLSTTTNEELSHGLIKLGLPYPVAFAISTALRMVPTFMGTGATIIEAQRSRGLNLEEGNIFARSKKYIPLLVPIFLVAIRGTDSLAIALESKGFRAPGERTYLFQIGFKPADYAVTIIVLIIVAVGIALSLMGYGQIPGFSYA